VLSVLHVHPLTGENKGPFIWQRTTLDQLPQNKRYSNCVAGKWTAFTASNQQQAYNVLTNERHFWKSANQS